MSNTHPLILGIIGAPFFHIPLEFDYRDGYGLFLYFLSIGIFKVDF